VRDFMKQALLEVYSDYLIISSSQTTATGLSKVLDNKTSHDSFTRFLSFGGLQPKGSVDAGNPLVRAHESESRGFSLLTTPFWKSPTAVKTR